MLDRLALSALPVLRGERVLLRDVAASDVDDRLRHPIDPEEREGVRREAVLYPDGWKDLILMGLLRSEYAAQRDAPDSSVQRDAPDSSGSA